MAKPVDEFIGIVDEIDCGAPSTILPIGVQKTSDYRPEGGSLLQCGGNEVIRYHRYVYHVYLLEISNPNPDPYYFDISGVIRDREGYQQSTSKYSQFWIRANSSRYATPEAAHQCMSYESPGNPCEAWNGFWEVENSVELFPDYEHQLTPGLLANDWGIHNTTDSDWEVGAVCEKDQPLTFGMGKEKSFEFPGHPKLFLSTWHIRMRWEVIKSQQKKMPLWNAWMQLPNWGTCDFYSKKQ